MEFVLTFHEAAEVHERYADPAQAPALIKPWMLYMDAMAAEGIVRGKNRLDVFGGTSVSVRGGKRQVQDGPFADTKDLLGGYVVIDVASIDEALKWAERCPSSLSGSTGVWPVMPTPKR